MTTAMAEDAHVNPFEVKPEDTQLAQRLALRDAVDSPFEYSLSVGVRQDELNWNIANGNVNVASEVAWKNTTLHEIRLAAQWSLVDDWKLQGVFTTGAVKSGSNQDSDYAASNRTQEYSRSDNKTGGAVRDLSLALGNRIKAIDFEDGTALHLTPLLGFSIHQQSLTMYDGRQTVPANGVLTGLNNSYDTTWQGAWLGLDSRLGIGGDLILMSNVAYHWADYAASANWNLRNDLSHPVSFKHVATGYGTSASIGAAYQYSKALSMHMLFETQQWRTGAGYDQTHFSYGLTSYYTLNAVQWNSQTILMGASYLF